MAGRVERWYTIAKECVQSVAPYIPPAALPSVLIYAKEEPGQEDYDRMAPGTEPLGRYRGVPYPRRVLGHQDAPPSEVILFYGPLHRASPTGDVELTRRTTEVLWHELMHHLGYTDTEMPDFPFTIQ